jgi:hypothetical protein
MAEEDGAVTFSTSPACGGWGKSLLARWQRLCGGTPTPALPRKQEREHTSARGGFPGAVVDYEITSPLSASPTAHSANA